MQYNNSLARQVAMAQNGRNGVRVMGRQSNPVSVGACGTPWDATAGYGTGQYGLQYGVNQNFFPSLPQNAPNAGAFLVNPNQVLQQNYSPLGMRFQAVAGQTTNVELAAHWKSGPVIAAGEPASNPVSVKKSAIAAPKAHYAAFGGHVEYESARERQDAALNERAFSTRLSARSIAGSLAEWFTVEHGPAPRA
jgi:hypothetical protein